MLPNLGAASTDQIWLKTTRDVHIATTPVFGMILVPDRLDMAQAIEAGRAWQRLHLAAADQGLAVDRGTPRQITRGAGDHEWPSWSGDGQRIYFARDAGRGPNVWSIDLDSGREAQITQQGGTKGVESADGKSLVYLPSLEPSRPLLTMPLGGGAPQQLLPCTRRWFFVSPRGIYYVPCGDDAMKAGTPTTGIYMELSLRLIDRAGGEDRPVAMLIEPMLGDPGGLAVSPDGTGIVFTRGMIKGSDLMLIENYR